jgi:4a-hydroxytetrahydrobiopterin dehydratase
METGGGSGVSESAPKALSPDDVRAKVADLEGWRVADGKLVKSFDFDDFVSAVRFVDRLADVAEQMGHHPDLNLGWGNVTAQLSTHSAGGITDADISLARGIDGVREG